MKWNGRNQREIETWAGTIFAPEGTSMKYFLICLAVLFSLSCTAPLIQPDQTPLTKAQVSILLQAAIRDIRSQGYEPLFLSEKRADIWCSDKEGKVKLYNLK